MRHDAFQSPEEGDGTINRCSAPQGAGVASQKRDPDSRLGETIERPETSELHPERASDHPGPLTPVLSPPRLTRRVPLVAAPVPTPTDPNSSSAR